MKQYELIFIIVNKGMGSMVLKKAKKLGLRGGTVFYGNGTISNPVMNFLSIYEERKEVLLLGADRQTTREALPALAAAFHMEKPNHGIMFTVPLTAIFGGQLTARDEGTTVEGEEHGRMFQNIITIVNRGRAEDVIEAAEAAGSRGGTIINGRGAGSQETSKVFLMDIEPEKEIVMILSKEQETEAIVQAIRSHLKIDEPGNGVLFVQDVGEVYGLYKG